MKKLIAAWLVFASMLGCAFAQTPGVAELGIDATGTVRNLYLRDRSGPAWRAFAMLDTLNNMVRPYGPAPGNFYVATALNGGSDSNDCLSATVSGEHGPCLTLAHAANVAYSYDAGNSSIVINVGAGTFNSGVTLSGPMRGLGRADVYGYFTYTWIKGAGSSQTTIDDTTSACGTIITNGGGQHVLLSHATFSKSAGCATGGAAVFAQNNSVVVTTTDFAVGTSVQQHIHAEAGAVVEVAADYTIKGNANYHLALSTGAKFLQDGYVATCTVSPTYSQFIQATSNATAILFPRSGGGLHFSGCGGSTGAKFYLDTNSVIDALGVAATYANLPGSTHGLYARGGQYTPMPVPTLSSCTNGSIDANSTDSLMRITFAGVSSTCTITFALQRGIGTVCTVGTNTATIPAITSSASTVVIAKSFVNTEVVQIRCDGAPY